ncbi:MAG: helix-turn-helix domain-containing protein, partial [Chloroflexota bacterium]|nr:helix-turn-helix domain-containing protein [Chloroflexota bacterium]
MGSEEAGAPTGETPSASGEELAHQEATAFDYSRRSQPRKTLAQKLDHLFHAVHPRGRGEYSLEEVAEGIRGRGGPTISATYIWQLRKGLKDNPTKKHLEALADFFGVSPLYFFDDEAAAQIESEIELLVTLRDAPVRYIAMRSVGLSAQSLQAIT